MGAMWGGYPLVLSWGIPRQDLRRELRQDRGYLPTESEARPETGTVLPVLFSHLNIIQKKYYLKWRERNYIWRRPLLPPADNRGMRRDFCVHCDA